MRFLIKFSYDGSAYCGFQKQPNKQTIEKELEIALTKINAAKKISITATGRTDKKVHALCQYAHCDLDITITEKNLKRALNSNLPPDIHIIETKQVSSSFHARYNVKEKEYNYYLNTGEYNPILRNYVFQYNHDLDLKKMQLAIKYFKGKHDFRAFVTENKEKDNCIRTIRKCSISKKDNIIIFTFIGDGFLRYQVRNMVGLLIKAGENKISPETVEKILQSKNRILAGKTAPAEGLYLTNITFKDIN